MTTLENKHAKNRKSPDNEKTYTDAYRQLNPSANKKGDGLDIAAVTTRAGEKGYGLMREEHNRSHDRDFHIVKDFIPMSEIKKQMKK
jgi:hypothetical protein